MTSPSPRQSPYTPIERKPMAHAIGFLSIQFSPNAASPRRLCQLPWTQPTRKKSRLPFRRNHPRRNNRRQRQPLFGREREGGASLREAAFLASPQPVLIGRGGSVSRRDHNRVYRRAPVLTGGTNYAEAYPPIASRSSGGSARKELLSEKLPPSHPPNPYL